MILGIGAGLVFWKNKVGGHSTGSFNSISKEEIELLLADVAKTQPMALKRFQENPEMKKEQLENLKELLAFASQAQKEGLVSEQPDKQEMENIRSEIIAVTYDREINKDKGPMPPFGFIGEDRVKAFWGEGEQPNPGFWQSFKNKIGLGKKDPEIEFKKFLDSKVEILKRDNPQMKDREISEDEKTQARDFFAKIEIYQDEYEQKARAGELPKELQDKVNLQVKLQQAQYLARQYTKKLEDKAKVTDEDVDKYIAEHPELNPAEKRTKAQEILDRAKGGEDFGELAKQFSEDPGSKDKGGLYENTPKGRMVAPFEQAALALEPGQISPNLVETDFGFHIIKLEKKSESKDASGQPSETYDVRHILIGTGFKDPENPMGREMPVKQYVRSKLEEEKQKKLVDDIVAANQVTVPDDFTVPEVSEEQIRESMKQQQQQQQQMQMNMPDGEELDGPPAPADAKKPAPKKPEPKKK